ncbi:C40 family peptidase [Nocardia sp. NPDC003345]
MTSAEIGPIPVDIEVEEPDDASRPGTPWHVGERRKWGAGGNGSPAPGTPAPPAAPPGQGGGPSSAAGPAAAPAPATGPAPGPGVSAPATVPAAAPVAAAPAAVTGPPGQPAAPPATAAPPGEERPEPEPLVDPEMLAQMAPMALMAGSALLPMIGSALSGLLGGGSGGGGAAPAAETGATGMDPQSDRAMRVLKALEAMYGEGEPADPEVRELREKLGVPAAGSGEGPAMVKAKQMFQANRATAFNNLDKQFAKYVSTLGGTNKADQTALRKLLKQTNAALAELGPIAYTKEGQQKVRQILTVALKAAHQIVSGSSANAGDTASAINQLTNQYLYNILGKELPGGVKFITAAAAASAGAASARAQFAVKTALAQIGDPYVWGAEGPGSFDCSGLTQYAAGKAGVNIPRTADQQYRALPRVDPGDIKPGDLIFPASSYKNGQMGHVLMYIGNGECVHAPRTGQDVQRTSLPKSYAAGRYA